MDVEQFKENVQDHAGCSDNVIENDFINAVRENPDEIDQMITTVEVYRPALAQRLQKYLKHTRV